MAPEQLKNQAIDGRADLFALGIVVHELLTGKLPGFPGSSMSATVSKQLADADPAIPKPVQQLVLYMTALNPMQRYRTGEQLVDAIDTVLAPMPNDGSLTDLMADAFGERSDLAAWLARVEHRPD